MRVYAHVDRGRRTPNLRNLALILLIGLATPGLGIQAQDAVWLKGQAVAVTPEFEPEDQPITFKKAPTATFSVGGETLVTCLAYSPDGKTLAVGDGPSHPVCTLGAPPPINENGGLIRLIDTSTHRVRMTLRRRKFPEHEYGVNRLVIPPGGTLLVSQGWESRREDDGLRPLVITGFTTWDLATGRERHRILGAEEPSRPSLTAISPDGRSLVMKIGEGTIRVWDSGTGLERLTIKVLDHRTPADDGIETMEFSPDGSLLAIGCRGGDVRLFEVKTGRGVTDFRGHERAGGRFCIGMLSFSRDGDTLAAEGSFLHKVKGVWKTDSEVTLFDVAKRRELVILPGCDDEIFFSMTFLLDGKTLATGSHDGSIRLWDTAPGRGRSVYKGDESWLLKLLPSPDGKILAAGDRRSVTLWDVNTGERRADLLEHYTDVNHLAFSPDGRTLASAGGSLKLWDMRVALEPKPDEGHLYEVTCVAYSPDGRTLASGSVDRSVKLWDPERRCPGMTLRGHFEPVVCLAYAPDGGALASGGQDGVVKIRDAATGKDHASFRAHPDSVRALGFSPDGGTVATASGRVTYEEQSGEVKLWDTRTGKQRAALDRFPSPVNALAFSPDGSVLALGCDDGAISLRDLAAGRSRATFALPSQDSYRSKGILCLAYSPDGRMLAAGSEDCTVGLWDVASGRERRVGELKHDEFVVALAFSRDGKYLATCARDKTLRVWEVASRREIASTSSPTDWFTSASFSPDGKKLAAGNRDASILIWDFEKVLASRGVPR